MTRQRRKSDPPPQATHAVAAELGAPDAPHVAIEPGDTPNTTPIVWFVVRGRGQPIVHAARARGLSVCGSILTGLDPAKYHNTRAPDLTKHRVCEECHAGVLS